MKAKLKDFMSPHPLSVRDDESLGPAYFRMVREGYRHLPVIDSAGHVIGIISDRDFQRSMWPVSLADLIETQGPVFKANALVSDYMTWPVKTLAHTEELEAAVRLMIDEKVSAVVITENQEMVGIITSEDLLVVLAAYVKSHESLSDKVKAFAYNSPIGKVVDLLSNNGI